MIKSGEIREILKQYEKHGWILRRVLLSAPAKASLPGSMFETIETIASDFDALWFARPSAKGGEAWELRSISTTPFALVEVFEDADEEAVREEIRQKMQTQMQERASKNIGRIPKV